ncbi:uncharacterized protein [Narcine bancroftii]|uniref:uncharacterized protein n=1 Tax=Narcine bancroftii TaxID=1343680 RepID=UPI003831239C
MADKGKDNMCQCCKEFFPIHFNAHPVAVLFPHWNLQRLIGDAQKVVDALIDLSVCSQCVNALIWILPLSCDILEQLITLLEKSQSSPMACPRLMEKGVATLWNQPHLRDFLQVIGYEQAGHFLFHNPRNKNKSLLRGSLNLFLALHPQSPDCQCKLDPQDHTSAYIRVQQSTQDSQEASALGEVQSIQGPQENLVLGEDLSIWESRETLLVREDQSIGQSQESSALMYGQMKQSPQENLLSAGEQESLAQREEQSCQGPLEPLTDTLRGKKDRPGSQETPAERTRKIMQSPQKNARVKKMKQNSCKMATRRNMRIRDGPWEASLANDKLSEQSAQRSTEERMASGNSKVCLRTLKPLQILRHQAKTNSVRKKATEIITQTGLIDKSRCY